MANVIEKKVYYLGQWQNNVIDNSVINQINAEIQNAKGNKVTLQLSADGLRVVKNSIMMGKVLTDFLPIDGIKFLTVSQRMPDLLLVISLAVNPESKQKYMVMAFRCANGMDAGIFLVGFRAVQKTVKTVTIKHTSPNQTQEEINWTLRNKGVDNSKRELKKLVDLHGEKAVVHKTNGSVTVVSNGHAEEVQEHGVRIPIYRKGKPSQTRVSTSVEDDSAFDTSDTRSEVSESALRNELETLSQELRDIKLMLEKSTGITAGSEPNSPREFQQKSPREFQAMNVKVHSHPIKQDVVMIRQDEPTYTTEIYENEPVQMRGRVVKQNGYHVTSEGNNTHRVSVSVPDYRSIAERTPDHADRVTGHVSSNHVIGHVSKNDSGFGSVTSRTSTTSYENWKHNTMQRNVVHSADLPERIRWKSRASHVGHVVTTRPRSALPSWSSDAVDSSGMVEVRHHTMKVAPRYQRASFQPRSVKVKGSKTESHSIRVKGMPSTVVRPIENVYKGRPEAKHGSVVYRNTSAPVRPTIMMQDDALNASQTIYVEQNNNVVKTELNEDHSPIDVRGIDLYNDTPVTGAVIRT